MAYSTQIAVSDGTLVLLDLSITYLDRDEIHVLFDEVEDDMPWAWVGASDHKISFSPAVPTGVTVTVTRKTDLSAPRHVFTQGAAFTSVSLDEDIRQILHIAQEATEGKLGGDFFQDINMHGNQIKNLGPAIDPNDAVPLAQYISESAGAVAARVAAEAAASAASASQSAAASSASSASTSASTATTGANTATAKAAEAVVSAAAALASEVAAAASYDLFDDRYLGAKASEPTLDNDGAALVVGALFFHTGVGLKVWEGSAWVSTGNVANAVTLAGIQTLTNKTLTAPLVNTLVNFTGTSGVIQVGGVDKLTVTQTAIVPASGVTLVGNGPVFRATLASNFGPLPANADTDLATASITEVFDTAGAQTGFVFVAPIAGYYQFNGQTTVTSSTVTLHLVEAWLSLSGTKVEVGSFPYAAVNFSDISSTVGGTFFMTAGSTMKFGVRAVGGGTLTLTKAAFSGCLVRAA